MNEQSLIQSMESLTPSLLSLNKSKNLISRFLPMKVSDDVCRSEVKKWYYSQDPYYRRGELLFRLAFGPRFKSSLKKMTYLLIRPDAIVSRSVDKILDILKDFNFVAENIISIRCSRHVTRSLYYYHLNHAPLERFPIVDYFSEGEDFLVVILSEQSELNHAASVHFNKVKGSVLIEKRKPEDFRSRINAKGGLLSFIHAPDEPADVIRELSIFFEEDILLNILKEFGSSKPSSQLENIVKSCYQRSSFHDLNLEKSIERIKKACQLNLISKKTSCKILNFCQITGQDRFGNALDILSLAKQFQLYLNKWDLVTLISHHSKGELSKISSLDE